MYDENGNLTDRQVLDWAIHEDHATGTHPDEDEPEPTESVRDRVLAAFDHCVHKLGFTAPELQHQRLQELRAQIAEILNPDPPEADQAEWERHLQPETRHGQR